MEPLLQTTCTERRSRFTGLVVACALCLIPGHGRAAEPKPGFCSLARGAARTPVDFKLAKVEQYNQAAAQQGRPTIRYQAYRLAKPGCTQSMDFVFQGLDKDQFRAVRKLYGDVGRSQPKRGRAQYRLVDFLSPLIQALDGQVFNWDGRVVLQVNEGRTGAYGTANAPTDPYVRTTTNCWSTLYAVLKDVDDKAARPRKDYPLFYTGRFQAAEVLAQISKPLVKVQVKKAAKVTLPAGAKIAFGDLLLIKRTRRQLRNVERDRTGEVLSSTPGKPIKLLEHAGLFVDDNLIFEKPDGGSDLPFRLVSLADAMAPYRSSDPLELQIRR